jgi:hypothetical protein
MKNLKPFTYLRIVGVQTTNSATEEYTSITCDFVYAYIYNIIKTCLHQSFKMSSKYKMRQEFTDKIY